ncbi:MAG: type II CAAX endopeptidase family protein [Oscillospiraceae bacterium]
MNNYKYNPILFYIIVFTLTWGFWITAIFVNNENTSLFFMFLGLCVPAVTAIITVFTSKSKPLKDDFKRKIFRMHRIKPTSILMGIILYGAIVVTSILLSTLFGQSLSQFSFIEDFSFSINGSSALLIIIFASIIEEFGWRGYGEDAIAQYSTWFKESIIFGIIWACWHIPLFFIEGTYQQGLTVLGFGYVLNFLLGVIPLGFITTWVYVKNNRSMLACIIFHMFINFFQEKIAMTPQTKCVESGVILLVAILLVVTNKEMFFGRKHIGKLPEEI